MNETHTKEAPIAHIHGPACGHKAVKHNGHIDYLQDGRLQNMRGDRVQVHEIDVSRINPVRCTPSHQCGGHEQGHVHGPKCGHEAVPHGDHVDYLVQDHLHHPHHGHCDDHGILQFAQ